MPALVFKIFACIINVPQVWKKEKLCCQFRLKKHAFSFLSIPSPGSRNQLPLGLNCLGTGSLTRGNKI